MVLLLSALMSEYSGGVGSVAADDVALLKIESLLLNGNLHSRPRADLIVCVVLKDTALCVNELCVGCCECGVFASVVVAPWCEASDHVTVVAGSCAHLWEMLWCCGIMLNGRGHEGNSASGSGMG